MSLATRANPDLAVGEDLRPRWNSAPFRRHGFHNMHRITRYVQGFRAGHVLDLRLSADLRLAARDDVRWLTATPWFSAMAVTEGNRLLHEAYAPDFGPDRPHAIMSISKMSTNLLIGRLVEDGRLRTDERVGDILPWIGPGYADATVQDVLNMNVVNAYDEDYHNPDAGLVRYEAATGGRLPDGPEASGRDFIAGIGLAAGAADSVNRTGSYHYKSPNTDVLAFVAQARGVSLQGWLADLADAAGVEGMLHVGTDRAGFPQLNAGICVTARDLARYGAVFARMGAGVDGRSFGSAAFLRATLAGGVPQPAPRAHLRYSNQTVTNGTWLRHVGYGGQHLVANPDTGRVACYLSVLQDEDGYDADYFLPIIAMLVEICAGG